jgi:stress response protein YsnF
MDISEKSARFEDMVKRFGLTEEQAQELSDFIDKAEQDAYEKGSDAEAYANAVG